MTGVAKLEEWEARQFAVGDISQLLELAFDKGRALGFVALDRMGGTVFGNGGVVWA